MLCLFCCFLCFTTYFSCACFVKVITNFVPKIYKIELMKRFLLVSLSSVYCMLLCAANWYVATSGNDANDGHSWQTAKFTIDQTIRTASSGDSVLVAAGTYYQTFVLKDGVHVLGGYDANSGLRDIDAYATIIDGTNLNAPLVTTKAKFAVPTYVEGLVLQNATHTSNGGAASLKANAILNRCTIRNCYTDGSGGAVHNNGGTICNSVIELCESLGAGGAVHNLGGLVENTIIRGCKGNYAAIRNESDGVVRNCLLHNNEPSGSAWPNSGGIYNPSGVVYNNTLVCKGSVSLLKYTCKSRIKRSVYVCGKALAVAHSDTAYTALHTCKVADKVSHISRVKTRVTLGACFLFVSKYSECRILRHTCIEYCHN